MPTIPHSCHMYVIQHVLFVHFNTEQHMHCINFNSTGEKIVHITTVYVYTYI